MKNTLSVLSLVLLMVLSPLDAGRASITIIARQRHC